MFVRCFHDREGGATCHTSYTAAVPEERFLECLLFRGSEGLKKGGWPVKGGGSEPLTGHSQGLRH